VVSAVGKKGPGIACFENVGVVFEERDIQERGVKI
jgi:hypothetical protein